MYIFVFIYACITSICLFINSLISPFALPSAPRRVPGRRGLTFSARGQELLSAPGLPLRFPFSRNSSLLPLLHIFPENIRCIVSHFRASSTRPLSVSSVSFISIRLIGWCTPPHSPPTARVHLDPYICICNTAAVIKLCCYIWQIKSAGTKLTQSLYQITRVYEFKLGD